MNVENERKDCTVWRKYLRHEQDSQMFAPEPKSAGIFCVREVSGYAVWYRRHLHDNPLSSLPDGDYLLRFFSPSSRHSAIEFAVLASRPGLSVEEAVAALDADAKVAMALQESEEVKPPFERVQ